MDTTTTFNLRIVSLTDLDKMAATIGVMLAFGVVKSAVSYEVQRQVSSTLVKQSQVQKMRKSIDGVRDRLLRGAQSDFSGVIRWRGAQGQREYWRTRRWRLGGPCRL